jgi:hypothetical protein
MRVGEPAFAPSSPVSVLKPKSEQPTAEVAISINQPPTTAMVGLNQPLVVMGTTAGLGGNTPGVKTWMWSIVSGDTGTFNPNAATLNSTFTHTGGAGPVVLRWTITNSPCPPSTATLTLALNQSPVVNPCLS